MSGCLTSSMLLLLAFANPGSDWLGPRSGASAGAILLDGGSSDPSTAAAFRALAGGPNSHLIIVPTAMRDAALNPENLRAVPEFGRKVFGAEKVTVLHAGSREQASAAEFCEPLTRATAVYFLGGDHQRLIDRYAGTRFEDELWKLHQRGGTIGGSSAGAMVLGSYQATRPGRKGDRIAGDFAGFAFLSDTMIDVHFTERRRQPHIGPVLKKHRQLRGIGIDEKTALIIRPGRPLEVAGLGTVTLYRGKSVEVLRPLDPAAPR